MYPVQLIDLVAGRCSSLRDLRSPMLLVAPDSSSKRLVSEVSNAVVAAPVVEVPPTDL